MQHDLVITNGTVVTASDVFSAYIGIDDGRISTLSSELIEGNGTAAFPPRGFMDLGLPEREWWWSQSGANPSPMEIP